MEARQVMNKIIAGAALCGMCVLGAQSASAGSFEDNTGAAPSSARFPSVPLNDPAGLAFVKPGALWVANYGANQVVKYDVSVSPPKQETVITADLSGPSRLASAKGKLYVANTSANTVTVYNDKTGKEVPARKISGLTQPLGVGVDAQGNIYIANNGAADVAVYSSTGKLLGTVSTDTTGLGFDAPGALAVEGRNVFVGFGPGAETNSVREYAISKFLKSPLTPTLVLTNSNGVSGPTGIAFGGKPHTLLVGNLYPTDVTPFTLPKGTARTPITDHVVGPEGIAVDTKGDIYVANSQANNISVYSSSGKYKYTFQ
jgi:outer membrane protein assembly factor BamB